MKKALYNYLSILLILVVGSNSILSGFSVQEGNKFLSFEQDMLSDSQVDGNIHFFIENSSEKIIVPSIKLNGHGDADLDLSTFQAYKILQSSTLRLDWFNKKELFFDVQKLLYPFHFFL